MICLQEPAKRDTLANKERNTTAPQSYLDHRNLQHTIQETELRHTRFKDFGRN